MALIIVMTRSAGVASVPGPAVAIRRVGDGGDARGAATTAAGETV